MKDIFYYQLDPSYITEIIYFMIEYVEIEKTRKFVTRHYFWPTHSWDIKTYIKGYDIYLVSKAIC